MATIFFSEVKENRVILETRVAPIKSEFMTLPLTVVDTDIVKMKFHHWL